MPRPLIPNSTYLQPTTLPNPSLAPSPWAHTQRHSCAQDHTDSKNTQSLLGLGSQVHTRTVGTPGVQDKRCNVSRVLRSVYICVGWCGGDGRLPLTGVAIPLVRIHGVQYGFDSTHTCSSPGLCRHFLRSRCTFRSFIVAVSFPG